MQEISDIKTYAKSHDVPIMQDGGIEFICQYIQEHDVKSVLEIGSAIGYSAIRFAKIKDNIKVDCILTDPPYGTTACKWDSVVPFSDMWQRINKIIKPNGAIVLFGSEPFSSSLRMSNIKEYRYDWIWEKSYSVGFMNANKMPLRKTENISVFYKKLPTYNPQGVVEINKIQKRKKDKETTVYNDMGLKDGAYIQKLTNYPSNIIKTSKKEKTMHKYVLFMFL